MDFVQTMKGWRRMCETIQSENQKKSTGGWCKGCPIQGLCVIDTAVKDSADSELSQIGDKIQAWVAENPAPVYPTWGEWLESIEVIKYNNRADSINYLIRPTRKTNTQIPAELAQKLGIKPKEKT